MQYFFILGNHPKLSLAEILNVVPRLRIVAFEDAFCIAETNDDASGIDIASLQNRLGGTIKIGDVMEEMLPNDFQTLHAKILSFIDTNTQEKLSLGLSIYNPHSRWYHKLARTQREFGMHIKREIKDHGTRVRVVWGKEPDLSSVIVGKKNGYEFVFLCRADTVTLGRTRSVQDFSDYSKKDYGRPSRDDRSGMLPPKLAKIMINLTGTSPASSTILDPFCGSGTVLSEAALMDYTRIIGNDISTTAIQATRENLEWLSRMTGKKYFEKKQVELMEQDVKNLASAIGQNSIDAIVTEPFLGPPLTGKESAQDIANIVGKLEKIYAYSIKTFSKILRVHGRCVIVIPEFHHNKTLNIKTILSGSDLYTRDLSVQGIDLSKLIYARPGQKIQRKIHVLEKR